MRTLQRPFMTVTLILLLAAVSSTLLGQSDKSTKTEDLVTAMRYWDSMEPEKQLRIKKAFQQLQSLSPSRRIKVITELRRMTPDQILKLPEALNKYKSEDTHSRESKRMQAVRHHLWLLTQNEATQDRYRNLDRRSRRIFLLDIVKQQRETLLAQMTPAQREKLEALPTPMLNWELLKRSGKLSLPEGDSGSEKVLDLVQSFAELQEDLIEEMRKLPPHKWGPFFTQHSDNPQIRKLEEGLQSLSKADKHLIMHMFSRVFHRPPGRGFRGQPGRGRSPELRKANPDGPRRGSPSKGPSRRRHTDSPDSLGPDSKPSPREGLRPQRLPRRGPQSSKETGKQEFRRRGADPLPPDPEAAPEGSLPPVRPDTTWQEPLSG
ncbi:MAG: hypothetical protein P8R38_02110 [Planctomycetota bacterium]|nr:hypothetical protein [Planctomycetota bacterium]MDG2085582.1 hypothetical protein [Planctomycetota bacterium]